MKDFIIKEFSKVKINIDGDNAAKFSDYYNLLTEWNNKFNLTAITRFEDVVIKHFVDSACGLKYFEGNISLCDIGAGAGFPSLPLKILNNKINLTMIDKLNKRVTFLEEAVSRLKLDNCKCIHSRIEDAVNLRESFDRVTARAVALLPLLCEYALPHLKIGGLFIAYKTDTEKELQGAEKAINILGGKIVDINKYTIGEGYKRSLIVIKKIKRTAKIYPRKNADKLPL
ncbi:MAG: 16S rRNA (guanine(527)-N(7))-methyltransferase RsmG [Clostridia bacterium]|nr:16S rRNA (guanine(527)-N(7))-methyltransferase RsmG [Clostridia bacterium]